MELNYKASNIAKAEREMDLNFFETLEGIGNSTPSFTALLMILRAGGLSEQEADEILDSKGIETALKEAVEALGNAGFLAKMQEVPVKQTPSPATSQTTGEKTKA